MSQLDAVYGDKEARTFATNHGLQILYAPREQRDADEYSAMLGHFTDTRRRAAAAARSASTVIPASAARRASSAAPCSCRRSSRELGPERLVVIFEKLQADPGREDPLPPRQGLHRSTPAAPCVPPMDMDLHIAKAQQRWRYLPDVIDDGEEIAVDRLAHDIGSLPALAMPSRDRKWMRSPTHGSRSPTSEITVSQAARSSRRSSKPTQRPRLAAVEAA
jgi:type IV secretion system protein VirD4